MATTSPPSSSAPSSSSTGSRFKLDTLEIDDAEDLRSLPNHCLHHLSFLKVDGDNNLESTDRLGDVFATLSSLHWLTFRECDKLRSIAKGLEHLTALEHLSLINCKELDIARDEEGMPWKALNTSLRHLELCSLPQLVGLPTGLQHLSNLRSLILKGNHELEELPEWMSSFSSLEYLRLYKLPKLTCLPEAFRQLTSLKDLVTDFPRLAARYQGPNGSD